MLTQNQGRLLAEFINAAVRPDWDVAGILDALGRAREMGDAADVAVAAVAAARNPANRTPAVIALQGPHWAHAAVRRKRSSNATPRQGRTCATCYLDKDMCEARWAHDHPFESLADAKARAIAAADAGNPYTRRRLQGPESLNGRRVENVELPRMGVEDYDEHAARSE